MKKSLPIGIMVLIGIVAFIGIIAFWYMSTYNQLVKLDEQVNESWAQVENVYQRRADLIPNLVQTVKGYAAHEKETLQAVVEARAKVGQVTAGAVQNVINDPQSFAKFQQSQGQLSSALSRLMVVVERYPELKANQNFLQLQSQLEGTENRISVERRRFNEVTRNFNSTIRGFFKSFVANRMGLEKRPYFESQAGAEKAPEVKF